MNYKDNLRPAANHPAIQNLRRLLREYLESDMSNTIDSFARKLGKTANEIGRHLRGEYNPREKTVRQWALALGVEYEEMMQANFAYIDYPFPSENVPKKNGSHITKREVRETFDAMIEEVSTFVSDSDDLEYGKKVIEIIKHHRI